MIGQQAGMPYPLGATWQGEAVNFAVMSRAAQAIDLCLFEPGDDGDIEIARIRLTEHKGEIWHVALTGLKPGQSYGYRAYGPWLPSQGQFFNPAKLLLDPYAQCTTANVAWRADMQGPVPHKLDLADPQDNGSTALKSVVPEQEPFDWQGVPAPAIPWEDTVIYEMHVKGLTRLFPSIPEQDQGTYAGLARPEVIAYMKELGITTLQLLPVHMHLDDGFLQPKNLTNYWGYNSIGFFAPHPEYARDQRPLGVVREFKEMVRSLHSAGLEVILDVVYNHTGEAGTDGPLIHFRGLDNLTYYRHSAKNPGQYIDYTGCGNSLNLHNPHVLQLVIDSLRYWVTEMKVDGFRFDLAVTMGRTTEQFSVNSSFFKAIMQDPVLQKVKMIAEPWDLGPHGYQLGNFPQGWSELNGKYRDCMRSFWKGDLGMASEWASRFAGSQDLFHHNRRSPMASINFLTSHDGFTLNDLVSYNQKHNEANLENNRDGDNTNHSWNCGEEGLSTSRAILALRERQKRNLLATLFLSTGVPFLCAGDEMGRTQLGNNNGYCQDNPLSWLDWSLAAPGQPGRALRDFVKSWRFCASSTAFFAARAFSAARRDWRAGTTLSGTTPRGES